MNLSFSAWPYTTKKARPSLLAISPVGLVAHTNSSVITIYIDNNGEFTPILSWNPFEGNIAAICWFDASYTTEASKPVLVMASHNKKITVFDLCCKKNLIDFTLENDSASVVKWSPISSSTFFVGCKNGDFLCCSAVLDNNVKSHVKFSINVGFKIDFIAIEPMFGDTVLVASKSGQLNFISSVHSNQPKISAETYSLCDTTNEIFSVDFLESYSNYLMVVTKLGTIIYAIHEQMSFNVFSDNKIRYLYPLHGEGCKMLGVTDESVSLIQFKDSTVHRLSEVIITPTITNVPHENISALGFYNNKFLYISWNNWLTTIEVVKNKLFVTKRVKLLSSKPIDYKFKNKCILLGTANGCVLVTKQTNAALSKSPEAQQAENRAIARAYRRHSKQLDQSEPSEHSEVDPSDDIFPRVTSEADLQNAEGISKPEYELNSTHSIVSAQQRRHSINKYNDQHEESPITEAVPAIIQNDNVIVKVNEPSSTDSPAMYSTQPTRRSVDDTNAPILQTEKPTSKGTRFAISNPLKQTTIPGAKFVDDGEREKNTETIPSLSFNKPNGVNFQNKKKQSRHVTPNQDILNNAHRQRALSVVPNVMNAHQNSDSPKSQRITTYGISRSILWCFKLCDCPISHVFWITSNRILIVGKEACNGQFINHINIIDLKKRQITSILGKRLNSINLPVTNVLFYDRKKVVAIVFNDSLVVFINVSRLTPHVIGSLSYSSKTLVSFLADVDDVLRCVCLENNIAHFIDLHLENNSLNKLYSLNFKSINSEIVVLMWKYNSFRVGCADGKIYSIAIKANKQIETTQIAILKSAPTVLFDISFDSYIVIDNKNNGYAITETALTLKLEKFKILHKSLDPKQLEDHSQQQNKMELASNNENNIIIHNLPIPVKIIRPASENELVVRSPKKGRLLAIKKNPLEKFHPVYTPSVSKCLIMKPRAIWSSLLKDAISVPNPDYLDIAEKYGLPFAYKIIMIMKYPNFAHDQLCFIRNLTDTLVNSMKHSIEETPKETDNKKSKQNNNPEEYVDPKISEITINLNSFVGNFSKAHDTALLTNKKSPHYILNMYKALLLSSNPSDSTISAVTTKLIEDGFLKQAVDLLIMLGHWKDAVENLINAGNYKEAIKILNIHAKNCRDPETRKELSQITEKFIQCPYIAPGIIGITLIGDYPPAIQKLKDIGEVSQAILLEKALFS